ncbi:MAG: DUF4240 domain-containing protein [Candidatus Obscuribacterales bacterium]|jgi:hypothetical protein|nr:DUF4240 domain-containing protein [bacterium]MDP3511042.1 DUF4240 domain-containing protein [Candidatus Melainabacteria bacterium]
MDEQGFWYIIATSIEDADGDREVQLAKLKELLHQAPDEDIIAFQEMVDHMMDRAYRWELWGAAHVINGGLADDGFEYFRAGLIMAGKEIYEAALAEPDSLAYVEDIDDCEEFLFLACEVYEERNNDGAIYDRFREESLVTPDGEPFDVEDKNYFRAQYPRLWEKYCEEEPA